MNFIGYRLKKHHFLVEDVEGVYVDKYIEMVGESGGCRQEV